MPAYGLHWLPVNNVYIDPPTNTVVVGLKKLFMLSTCQEDAVDMMTVSK